MKYIFISLFTLLVLFSPAPALAACNFYQLMTAATKDISNFGSVCTITGVEGIDKPGALESSTQNTANLSLSTGSAVTINNGGSLVTGYLNLSGGSVAIQSGGQIKLNTPLYVADGDADGYTNSFTFYTATASGRRRLGLMRSYSTTDCSDATFSTNNQCCAVGTYYADADGDGYGAGGAISMCAAAGYVANNDDCNDASSAIRTVNATGGTITTSGSYKIHTFTSSGTFTLSCVGTGGNLSTEVLVVAGGGGGGKDYGGGGGGGGVIYNSSFAVSAAAYGVTVGNGGGSRTNGQNSVFSSLTAIGGGAGGEYWSGSAGGSGGGGGYNPGTGGSGTAGQGTSGGTSGSVAYRGSGGGGASQAGTANSSGGHGGNGYTSSISGVSTTYGGGGGGTASGQTPGNGGTGGGANGRSGQGNGNNGTANTGGGASASGGSSASYSGGTGGSGIVIIRYLNP